MASDSWSLAQMVVFFFSFQMCRPATGTLKHFFTQYSCEGSNKHAARPHHNSHGFCRSLQLISDSVHFRKDKIILVFFHSTLTVDFFGPHKGSLNIINTFLNSPVLEISVLDQPLKTGSIYSLSRIENSTELDEVGIRHV